MVWRYLLIKVAVLRHYDMLTTFVWLLKKLLGWLNHDEKHQKSISFVHHCFFFNIYICLLQITKFVDFSAWPCLLQDLLYIWFEIVLNFFDWFRVIRMKSRSDKKFVHNLWTIPPPYPHTTADLAPTIIYFH